MQMEYGQAIRFPRQDRGWIVKLAITSVLSLVPVLGQIVVAGYGQEIASRVYRDDAHPCPTGPIGAGCCDAASAG